MKCSRKGGKQQYQNSLGTREILSSPITAIQRSPMTHGTFARRSSKTSKNPVSFWYLQFHGLGSYCCCCRAPDRSHAHGPSSVFYCWAGSSCAQICRVGALQTGSMFWDRGQNGCGTGPSWIGPALRHGPSQALMGLTRSDVSIHAFPQMLSPLLVDNIRCYAVQDCFFVIAYVVAVVERLALAELLVQQKTHGVANDGCVEETPALTHALGHLLVPDYTDLGERRGAAQRDYRHVLRKVTSQKVDQKVTALAYIYTPTKVKLVLRVAFPV